MDNGGATKTYTYNVADELKADGTATFMFDGAGNRANSNYTVSGGNELTNDGTWTYTYDTVGNLLEKSKGTHAESWTYQYDPLNHLTTITRWTDDPGSNLASPANGATRNYQADYKYDYFGQRIEQDVDADGAGGGGTTVTKFAYMGGEIWADLDNSSSLTTRYVRGDAVDELYARIASGTVGWYLSDHLGSVRNVLDNSAVPGDHHL